ncbi:hypothetical protein LWI29_021982 [Acer saccharum]|uniref:NB-ARC domain-containing protein n=1 Tax=Acer saccharum TaxID=4024 RepID=A0AA39W4H1_ACESA|nr:hypothetical protein LWI29_021982 [Acer saccharum]
MSTLNDIIKALSNPNVNMVGVYGTDGIGKTTLARAVAEHAEYKMLFDVVAFAEVFEVPDIRRIQGEIADKLGLTFHEESVTERARKLHKCLKQKKQEEQEEQKEQKKNNDLKKLKEKKESKKEKEEKEQEKILLKIVVRLQQKIAVRPLQKFELGILQEIAARLLQEIAVRLLPKVVLVLLYNIWSKENHLSM